MADKIPRRRLNFYELTGRIKNPKVREAIRSVGPAALTLPLLLGSLVNLNLARLEKANRPPMTREAAADLLVDNWARTDRYFMDSYYGKSTMGQYLRNLNFPNDCRPLGEVYFSELSPDHVIRHTEDETATQVVFDFSRPKTLQQLQGIFTPTQRADLRGLMNRVAQRAGSASAQFVSVTDEGKPLGSSSTITEYTTTVVFSGGAKTELTDVEHGELQQIIAQTPAQRLRQLVEGREIANRRYHVAHKATTVSLLATLLALGVGTASRAFIRKREKEIEKQKTEALRRGEVPSQSEFLEEAGVGPVYRLVGSLFSPEVRNISAWLDKHAARLSTRLLTRREIRRSQPFAPEELERRLGLGRKSPVVFYGFWGGNKESESGLADSFDESALARLAGTVSDLPQKGLKKPIVKLVFADTNAKEINGISEERVSAYLNGIRSLALRHGFRVVTLSSLKKRREWKRLEEVFGWQAKEEAEKLWRNEQFRRGLTSRAEKHSETVKRGEASAEEVGRRYLQMRVLEGMILPHLSALGKSRGIHWSYKAGDHFVRDPTLYLHPYEERHINVLPWHRAA